MLAFYIHFIYPNSDADDVLSVYHTEDENVYRVTMKFGDYKNRYNEAFLSSNQVLSLVKTTLKSLSYDQEPLESIQILTMLAPTVLYDVADMYDIDVREMIEDTLYAALRTKTIQYKTN